MKNYKNDFPIFKQDKKFIYLDSACITLLPQSVLNSINEYYLKYSGCHGRGGHLFNEETSKKYNEARVKIQKFINAKYLEEIIFTKNTTEGINLIANSFPFASKDTVLTSDLEHNSNLLPWQKSSKPEKIKHKIFNTNNDTTFNMQNFLSCLDAQVKLVSVLHVSNLTGVTFPIAEIAHEVHKNNSYLLVDAAQSLNCKNIDVQKMSIDLLVSSLHKNFGPSGVGFVYVKKELLECFFEFMVGGETIIDTDYTESQRAEIPKRFEAGLQNYSGIIGAGEAISFIENVGRENICEYKIQLNKILTDKLKAIPKVKILGPEDAELRNGICSFIIEGIDSFAVAKILSDSKSIMMRAGFHCVHAWCHKNEVLPTLRVSLQIYNTPDDIEQLAKAISDIAKHFV